MLANVFTKTVRDRWRGVTIGTVVVGAFLLMGMSVYRDIDLSVYTNLPEAFRALANISEDTDVGGIAYGAIYGFYGALTLAALAVSMGAASIAGEERDGTLNLLLGNPKSRSQVLASKTASMVVLTGVGAGILWAAGLVVPEMLSVDVSGMAIGALIFHMFVNALFYGFVALAIGAWTGRRGLASGGAAGFMVISFFAAGLFPLVEGLENVAKAFPWYYFDGSQPVLNGVDWGHLSVLFAGSAVLLAVAFVGVNRRDLRGLTEGTTLVDRLRANPLTSKVVERLAGSTRVARVWIKTASEHQGLLFVTSAAMFGMSLMLGPMYTAIDETLRDIELPDALYALAGASSGSMSTAEGWFEVEIFGLMAPIAVMAVVVVMGARALAGEEARHTMGLLLANPISRSRVVLEKSIAMVIFAVAVGAAIVAGVAGGSVLAGLGVAIGDIAAASLLATLVGLVFGALALALSAGTGRVKLAVFGTVGAALGLHVANSLALVNDGMAGLAKWTPFHYYLSSDPLMNGMNWGHGAVLASLTLALVGLSVVLFDKRDLRQNG